MQNVHFFGATECQVEGAGTGVIVHISNTELLIAANNRVYPRQVFPQRGGLSSGPGTAGEPKKAALTTCECSF